MLFRRHSCAFLALALGAWTPSLNAQERPAATIDPDSMQAYFRAFAARRLIPVKLAEIRELREQLAQAENLAQAGKNAEAALLLSELTEHPRYADYAESSEFAAAHYALGTALWKLGAAGSAQKSLRFVLARGPEDPYFVPAFRRYVDIALSERQLGPALDTLAAYGGGAGVHQDAETAAALDSQVRGLPPDAQAELSYLRARERLQVGDKAEAKLAFARVTPDSRFYGSAQFELGAIAADECAYAEAQGHFCSVTRIRDDSVQGLLTDARYFTVKDLARLGEGRVGHEQRRGKLAFDQYFQIPNDSQRLPEALFEAAYARYEANDPDTAIDLLDQLQARFPRSPFSDEASLLRGYVALARCDFRAAEQHFAQFEQRFTPLVVLLDRTLKNPARRHAMYEALSTETASDPNARSIIGLLGRDALFRELHERVRQLDRQAASASRLPASFALLRARYLNGDKPLAGPIDAEAAEDAPALDELEQSVEDTRVALRALTEQLDTLRKLGAKPSELAELESSISQLAARQNKLRASLDAALLAAAEQPEVSEAHGQDVAELLQHDERTSRSYERRTLGLRPKLVAAANARALSELQALHTRLAGFLRRARIGHIDAAMGEKRRIEREVESLAAGRFPPELHAHAHGQAYLRDDEEYWPFEGEDWPDEFLQDEEAKPGQP